MNRFEEQDEVILDKHTGLIWTKNASPSDFPKTWDEALSFVKELNQSKLYGYKDWKIPNRRELFSLISQEAINPSLPPSHPFVNTFTGYYWTSTSCARLPDQAWYIHLGGARVFKGMKYNSYMIWPVRIADDYEIRIFQTGQQQCYDEKGNITGCKDTGQDGEFQTGIKFVKPRFTESEDFVHDNLTDLTWLKNANISIKMLNWQSAFDLVEMLNKESKYGFDDWRLPGIIELESLTDMGCHTPALPTGHPFINVEEFYWSSTTSMYDKRYAWALYLKDGAIGVGYKMLAEFYLWPVRGIVYKI